jgi:hypothetical protein
MTAQVDPVDRQGEHPIQRFANVAVPEEMLDALQHFRCLATVSLLWAIRLQRLGLLLENGEAHRNVEPVNDVSLKG